MNRRIYSGVFFLCSLLLVGCQAEKISYGPDLSSGYTVGYGYGAGYYGNGSASGYQGYGGWTSSYYSPGEANDYWANQDNGPFYAGLSSMLNQPRQVKHHP